MFVLPGAPASPAPHPFTRAGEVAGLGLTTQQRALGSARLQALPAHCANCDVRFAYNGGCPKDRFLITPWRTELHYLCKGCQLFFRHVDEPMRVMAGLLREGRDATALRDWHARNDANRDGAPLARRQRGNREGLPQG